MLAVSDTMVYTESHHSNIGGIKPRTYYDTLVTACMHVASLHLAGAGSIGNSVSSYLQV